MRMAVLWTCGQRTCHSALDKGPSRPAHGPKMPFLCLKLQVRITSATPGPVKGVQSGASFWRHPSEEVGLDPLPHPLDPDFIVGSNEMYKRKS